MKTIGTTALTLLTAVVAVATITASGQKEATGDSAEPITLTVWHAWANADVEPQALAFDTAVEEWNELHPDIEIEVDVASGEAYKQRIRTAFAANEVPDVFFSFTGTFSEPFVSAGKVLPLDEYLTDGTRDRLLDGALDITTYDGSVYGLPVSLHAAFIFTNKALMEEHGIAMPTTFEELISAIEKLRAAGVTPFAFGNKDRWPIILYYESLAVRHAGQSTVMDAINGDASFDQQPFIDAAADLSQMVEAGAFPEGAAAISDVEGTTLLATGDAAMCYTGTWNIPTFEDPDAPTYGQIVPIRFPAVRGGVGGKNDIWGGPFEMFGVSESTEHPDEAAMFVKFLTETMARKAYAQGVGIPMWRVDVPDSQVDSELLKQSVELLSDSESFTVGWDLLLPAATAEAYMDLCGEIVGQVITPEQFAAELQTAAAE